MTKTYMIKDANNSVLFEFEVVIPDNNGVPLYTDLQWDSRTGLVTGARNAKRVPLETKGNTVGTIDPSAFIPTSGSGALTGTNIISMDYNYWYY